MRIMIINPVYGIGSTGKIVESLFNEFTEKGHSVLCCYGRHSTIKDNQNIKKCAYEIESKIHHFISKILGNQYGGMFLSTRKLIRIIKQFKPDVIHLHLLNGYFVNSYSLFNYLKKKNIKTVLTNHSDMFLTGNCGNALNCDNWCKCNCKDCHYVKNFNGPLSLNRTNFFFKKMQNSISNFNSLKMTNVSPWLTSRSLKSPILSHVKTNTTIFNPISKFFFEHSKLNPYIKFNASSIKKVFYPTASFANPEKGGQHLFAIAEKMPDIIFFVKSNIPYENKSKIKNIIFIEEKVSQEELADFYYYADCTIVLSERETFSMVVAESLSEGTPVVGFLSGGPETIADGRFSLFSEYSNIDLFVENLYKILNSHLSKEAISGSAKMKFSASKIADQYIELYQ